MKQVARPGEMLTPRGVGKQPVVADAVEAVRQAVQEEAPHELVGRKRHGLLPGTALDPIVLPAEGHILAFHGNEPRVGNGYPMGIA